MSAYGAIKKSAKAVYPLPILQWTSSKGAPYLTTHHLTLANAREMDGLVEYLSLVFAEEIENGTTYPQEEMDRTLFESYFFAADVIIAIARKEGEGSEDKLELKLTLESAKAGRPWEECIAGFYYIKPNYPGRSSHICNAGFFVPPTQRGNGYGSILAKSYLEYGPSLGYQASVFNLVYANNIASIKLWDRLNFTRAGLIPRAGRLKCANGQGEEYVDAIVFYKRFLKE